MFIPATSATVTEILCLYGVPLGSKVQYECDTLNILRATLIILRATLNNLRATLNNLRATLNNLRGT